MKLSPLLLLLPCIHAFSVSLPTTVVTAVNALVSFIDNLIDPTPPLTPFDTWALTYGVTFEDSVDRDYRLSVWAHHDVFITAHNENSASYLVGHNAQSHLTGEEFASNRAIGPFATPPEHGRRGSEEVAEEEEDDGESAAAREGMLDGSVMIYKVRRRLYWQDRRPALCVNPRLLKGRQ